MNTEILLVDDNEDFLDSTKDVLQIQPEIITIIVTGYADEWRRRFARHSLKMFTPS